MYGFTVSALTQLDPQLKPEIKKFLDWLHSKSLSLNSDLYTKPISSLSIEQLTALNLPQYQSELQNLMTNVEQAIQNLNTAIQDFHSNIVSKSKIVIDYDYITL